MNIRPGEAEFDNFLNELVGSEEYKYRFLTNHLNLCVRGGAPLYETSVLNTNGEGWILIIHSDKLLVYGDNWNVEQFVEIAQVIDLYRFRNYEMSGDSVLLRELIAYFPIDRFSVVFERLFYAADSIAQLAQNELTVSPATEQDAPVLALMLQQFYHEEYGGENDKTLDEMNARIDKYISTNNIYVLRDGKNTIVSFCTIVDPDIGILFTGTQFRRQGYGGILLSYCSNLLLGHNDIVYLMTMKNISGSNAVCQKVGFQHFFEYLSVVVNPN